ncbi:TetR/AcrR family transcriptional regulator [Hamadaea tsunoensis]|uniref:TetR/AcrR family transcriptional regulator n=1 Tax=Hamadaea tsunoensis TaxID=53368 RepID=UPI0004039E0E|nr:TetR/AcrR family transcriptional regulator [Hamadaea tsunoensis]
MTAASVRSRVRAEMINEIKAVARRHLATDGANLSLRAVTRDLGMVSSAVYRYFASRDDLLTALIIDAYNDLGDAIDAAEAAVERTDYRGRWLALGREMRAWAIAHPPEYALLFGSPVPGYQAPQETVEPGIRPVRVCVAILNDAVAAGALRPSPGERIPKAARDQLALLRSGVVFEGLSEPVVFRATTSWAMLFGSISFELFGRYGPGVTDAGAILDHQLAEMADYMGLK